MADFVREVWETPASRSKKGPSAEAILKRLTEVIEHLQYVVTEGCFDELREMVRWVSMGIEGSYCLKFLFREGHR